MEKKSLGGGGERIKGKENRQAKRVLFARRSTAKGKNGVGGWGGGGIPKRPSRGEKRGCRRAGGGGGSNMGAGKGWVVS